MEALARGFLARRRALTLVAVGRTLREWQSRLEAGGMRVRTIEAGRPGPKDTPSILPPAVLVFGAAPARDRWRRALTASGMVEMRDFVFTA